MLGKTHIAAVLFLSALFFSFFSYDMVLNVFILLTFLVGGLFPDIDSSSSILGRKMPLISFFTKHRGFLHSLWALILFTFLVYIIFAKLIAIVFAIGYISHLLLDAITKEGIYFFGRRFKGPFKVGSFGERVFYISLLVATLLLYIN